MSRGIIIQTKNFNATFKWFYGFLFFASEPMCSSTSRVGSVSAAKVKYISEVESHTLFHLFPPRFYYRSAVFEFVRFELFFVQTAEQFHNNAQNLSSLDVFRIISYDAAQFHLSIISFVFHGRMQRN